MQHRSRMGILLILYITTPLIGLAANGPGPAAPIGYTVGTAPVSGIKELVDQVSEQRIGEHINALEFPRATPQSQARAQTYVVEQLKSYGYTVTLDPVLTSNNVIARLDGTQTPARVLVLGAHFDTVPGSPGADDNASGVAGLLEIARVLAHHRPASSIEFVAFGLEEVHPTSDSGCNGSLQYARQASAAGVEIIGMISLEMIAYTCSTSGCQFPFANVPPCLTVEPAGVDVGTFIAAVGNDASATLLDRFVAVARIYVPDLELAAARVAGMGDCFADSRRSDHAAFWDEGYRAIMITDTAKFRNPNYHTPNDTGDTLDLGFARLVTQATLAAIVLETEFLPEEAPAASVWVYIVTAVLVLTTTGAIIIRRRTVPATATGSAGA